MDPSPWKGECLLVPWAEVSNKSQSDLAAEGMTWLLPSCQLWRSSDQLLSCSHSLCQEEGNCTLSPETKKSKQIFVVPVGSGYEGVRERLWGSVDERTGRGIHRSPRGAWVRGQAGVSVSGGAAGPAASHPWSPSELGRASSVPPRSSKDAVGAWRSNCQTWT